MQKQQRKDLGELLLKGRVHLAQPSDLLGVLPLVHEDVGEEAADYRALFLVLEYLAVISNTI